MWTGGEAIGEKKGTVIVMGDFPVRRDLYLSRASTEAFDGVVFGEADNLIRVRISRAGFADRFNDFLRSWSSTAKNHSSSGERLPNDKNP